MTINFIKEKLPSLSSMQEYAANGVSYASGVISQAKENLPSLSSVQKYAANGVSYASDMISCAIDKTLFTIIKIKSLISSNFYKTYHFMADINLSVSNIASRHSQESAYKFAHTNGPDSSLMHTIVDANDLAKNALAKNLEAVNPSYFDNQEEPSSSPSHARSKSYSVNYPPLRPSKPIIPKEQLEEFRGALNECPGMSYAISAPIRAHSIIGQLNKPQDSETTNDKLLSLTQASFSFINAIGAISLNILWILSKILEGVDVQASLWVLVEKITIIGGLVVSLIEFTFELCDLKRAFCLSRDSAFSQDAYLKKLEASLQETKEKQLEILSTLIQEMDKNKSSLVEVHGIETFDMIYYLLKSYRREVRLLEKPDFKKFEAKFLSLHLKSFDKRKLQPTKEEIIEIQKKASLSEKRAEEEALKLKLNHLSRRIGPLMVDKLQKELEPILSDLKSPVESIRNAASEKARNLIDNADIQTRKAMIIHISALFSLAVTITGIVLALAVFLNPFVLPATLVALPTILFWSGGGLLFLKYCFTRGFLNTEGWNFSWYHATSCFVTAYTSVKNVAITAIDYVACAFKKLTRDPEESPIKSHHVRSYSI